MCELTTASQRVQMRILTARAEAVAAVLLVGVTPGGSSRAECLQPLLLLPLLPVVVVMLLLMLLLLLLLCPLFWLLLRLLLCLRLLPRLLLLWPVLLLQPFMPLQYPLMPLSMRSSLLLLLPLLWSLSLPPRALFLEHRWGSLSIRRQRRELRRKQQAPQLQLRRQGVMRPNGAARAMASTAYGRGSRCCSRTISSSSRQQ